MADSADAMFIFYTGDTEMRLIPHSLANSFSLAESSSFDRSELRRCSEARYSNAAPVAKSRPICSFAE